MNNAETKFDMTTLFQIIIRKFVKLYEKPPSRHKHRLKNRTEVRGCGQLPSPYCYLPFYGHNGHQRNWYNFSTSLRCHYQLTVAIIGKLILLHLNETRGRGEKSCRLHLDRAPCLLNGSLGSGTVQQSTNKSLHCNTKTEVAQTLAGQIKHLI